MTEDKSPVRKFFIGFAALGLPLLAVAALAGEAISGAAARAMARSAGGVLGLLGFENRSDGAAIRFEGRDLEVGVSCTALGYAAVFLCAVAAWPAPWRRRAAALGVGVVLLYVMDLVRLSGLVLMTRSAHFESVHILSGAAYVAVLLVLWLLWTRLSGVPVRVRLAHPAVAAAIALAFLVGAGELALAQGPPPPPAAADIPLGGAPFALAGVAISSWLLLRRQR